MIDFLSNFKTRVSFNLTLKKSNNIPVPSEKLVQCSPISALLCDKIKRKMTKIGDFPYLHNTRKSKWRKGLYF